MDEQETQEILTALATGTRYRFSDWPNPDVPKIAAGVYAVWRGEELVYVGMSGRGEKQEREPWGLFTRLNSHASGRRSGDQFCVYVCDRLIIPGLEPADLARIGEGALSLDVLTRDFIRRELAYTFATVPDGRAALRVEHTARAEGLGAGPPRLNPLG